MAYTQFLSQIFPATQWTGGPWPAAGWASCSSAALSQVDPTSQVLPEKHLLSQVQERRGWSGGSGWQGSPVGWKQDLPSSYPRTGRFRLIEIPVITLSPEWATNLTDTNVNRNTLFVAVLFSWKLEIHPHISGRPRPEWIGRSALLWLRVSSWLDHQVFFSDAELIINGRSCFPALLTGNTCRTLFFFKHISCFWMKTPGGWWRHAEGISSFKEAVRDDHAQGQRPRFDMQ